MFPLLTNQVGKVWDTTRYGSWWDGKTVWVLLQGSIPRTRNRIPRRHRSRLTQISILPIATWSRSTGCQKMYILNYGSTLVGASSGCPKIASLGPDHAWPISLKEWIRSVPWPSKYISSNKSLSNWDKNNHFWGVDEGLGTPILQNRINLNLSGCPNSCISKNIVKTTKTGFL